MKTARNSLKGYTYQNYIFTLLLAKMDGKLTIVPREPIEEHIVTTITRNGVCMVAEDRVVYR